MKDAHMTLLRGGFRLLSTVSTSAASRMAFEVFRTPRRFRTPPRERELLAGATPFEMQLDRSITLRAWRWGHGPAVLLAHGWEGRGSQMATFAAPLVHAGFSAIAWDAPGHGASTGRQSSLPHFAWALRRVAELNGPVHAVIAHSLGCAAATVALRDGAAIPRAVFIAPPLNPADYTRQFGEMFGLGDDVVQGLRDRVEERFLRKWDDFSLGAIAPQMTAPLLVVHDRDDVDTPWSGGSRLAELWPGARLMTTEGLGHRRVLREDKVLAGVLGFLQS